MDANIVKINVKKIKREYWTVHLHLLRRNLSVWCTFRCRNQNKKSTDYLITLVATLGITIQTDIDMDEINKKINLTIQKELVEHDKKARDMRESGSHPRWGIPCD